MSNKKPYLFRLQMKLKNTTAPSSALGKGVIVQQDIVYELTEKERGSSMFAAALLSEKEEFIERNMEITLEEVKDGEEEQKRTQSSQAKSEEKTTVQT